jgi:phospholipase/carboxylesterase
VPEGRITPAPFGLRETGSPRGEAEWAGVLLHGRERTKQEMLDLAGRLHFEGVRWLAPYADAGKWYPGRFRDPLAANEPQLTRAVERCGRVLEEAREGGRLGPERIFIAGFSQGACVAVEYALRHPGRCGAILVFTGCMMGPPGNRSMRGKPLRGLKVFITGSDIDEWVPEESTRHTARVLSNFGADVTLRVYPGRPHVVSDEEVAEARAFLQGLRAIG